MIALATPTDAKSPEQVSPLCHHLAESIGVPFESIRLNDLSSTAWIGPLLKTDELSTGLREVEDEGYAIFTVGDRRLAILVNEVDGEAVAVGVVSATDHEWVGRLVSLTLRFANQDSRLNQQADELDSCIEQLSYNMEEQTWLRTLSEQMRLCDVQLDAQSVADQLLTSLQGLIRAESIALFSGDFSTPGSIGNVTTTWVGHSFANDDVWNEWLTCLSASSVRPRTHVANEGHVDAPLRHCGVESLLAVPLQSSHRLRGWLVAVNRPSGEGQSPSVNRFSETEFGTVEASLAEAAGNLVATHGHNADLLHEQEQLVLDVIKSISSAIDARDPYTRGHSDRVGYYAQLLARRLQMSEHECERIYLCGLLHDVGKIGVPDHVLLKPGRLTDEEFAHIKQHPQIGYRIVRNLTQLADLLPGILYHHESLDGSGYPHGLVGEEIPYQARILAVADAYDAMTSDRPYRGGMSHEKATGILQERAGIQWDAAIVHELLQIPLHQLRRNIKTNDGTSANDHAAAP